MVVLLLKGALKAAIFGIMFFVYPMNILQMLKVASAISYANLNNIRGGIENSFMYNA